MSTSKMKAGASQQSLTQAGGQKDRQAGPCQRFSTLGKSKTPYLGSLTWANLAQIQGNHTTTQVIKTVTHSFNPTKNL